MCTFLCRCETVCTSEGDRSENNYSLPDLFFQGTLLIMVFQFVGDSNVCVCPKYNIYDALYKGDRIQIRYHRASVLSGVFYIFLGASVDSHFLPTCSTSSQNLMRTMYCFDQSGGFLICLRFSQLKSNSVFLLLYYCTLCPWFTTHPLERSMAIFTFLGIAYA